MDNSVLYYYALNINSLTVRKLQTVSMPLPILICGISLFQLAAMLFTKNMNLGISPSTCAVLLFLHFFF